MLRLCTVALALMACGVVAAPAPVFRPGKTPYEVMLAGLRKTGKATWPYSKDGGTWKLTVEKVEGDRLTKVKLVTLAERGGRELAVVITASHARIYAARGNAGGFALRCYGVVIEGGGVDGDAAEKTLSFEVGP